MMAIANPLPPCVREWVDLVVNPFRHADKICMPLPPATPAAPLTTWVKGVFVTGTTPEKGFVSMAPRQMCVNDAAAVAYTTSAFVGTTIVTSGTGVFIAQPNSPYVTADFGVDPAIADMQYRVVAAGLRVRNITPIVDRGGRLQLTAEPDHNSLVGSDYTDLTAYDSTYSGKIDGDWSTVVYVPARTSNSDYLDGINGNHTLGVICAAPAGKPQTYEYEGWAHFQLIGAKARGKQKVAIDVVGGNMAWEAMSDTLSDRVKVTASAIYDHVRDRLYDTMTREGNKMLLRATGEL